jgi:hypothetical protein
MKRTVVVALMAGFALLGAGTASADESTPAPVTLSSEQVKKICEQRIPRAEERVQRLTDRINGGPEVIGSTENLKKRAEDARAAGRTEQAERLDTRAGWRQDHLDKLGKAKDRLAKFKTEHCGYLGGGK